MVFNLLPLKREDAFFRALSIKYEKLTKKTMAEANIRKQNNTNKADIK